MHCPRLTKVHLKAKEMPDTTFLSRSRPGAIMTRVFNLQIKMTLRGPTLTNRNRNKFFQLAFQEEGGCMSFLLIILYWNEKPLCSTFKCIVLSFLYQYFKCLSTIVYPHPDLVLSWISSLLASLRTTLFHSNIVSKFSVCWSGHITFFSASRSWQSFTPAYILFLILYFCSFPALLSSVLLISF